MKTIRENTGVLILCIAELLVGILLLINPVGFTAGIVIAAGVLLIASGAAKKTVVEQAFFGPVTPRVPASILQLHPDVTVIYSET